MAVGCFVLGVLALAACVNLILILWNASSKIGMQARQ